MSELSIPTLRRSMSRVLTLLSGVLFVALSAQVTVPMVPVPMTLQTFAVLVIGALAGWRMALATLGGYVLAAALGAPVLADGTSGVDRLTGPTAGYIFGFFWAGALVGLPRVRLWAGLRFIRWSVAMVFGHVVILLCGFGWLGLTIGWSPAFEHGVHPFLVGAVVKSCLAAISVVGLRRMLNASRAQKAMP